MTTRNTIDRKAFLASSLAACATIGLGGCSGESETGGTENSGGSATGGTAAGGTGGSATGGTGTGGTGTGGAAIGGSATGGTNASSGGMTGGTDSGGSGGDTTYTCTTDTNNGTHSHPLTVPSSDVARGYQDAPYTLEDGGTGHTHTVELTAYDYLYLQGGSTVTVQSSVNENHSHPCVIGCIHD